MIITVSAQEIKKGLPVKDGWYKATVKSIDSKPSKDSQSINYTTIVTIDDGSHEGREIKDQFNSKFMAPFSQFVSAITGNPVNGDQDLQIDTDSLLAKQLKVKIKNDLYNGLMIPKFGAFLPVGVDTDSVPF